MCIRDRQKAAEEEAKKQQQAQEFAQQCLANPSYSTECPNYPGTTTGGDGNAGNNTGGDNGNNTGNDNGNSGGTGGNTGTQRRHSVVSKTQTTRLPLMQSEGALFLFC